MHPPLYIWGGESVKKIFLLGISIGVSGMKCFAGSLPHPSGSDPQMDYSIENGGWF